MCASVPRSLQPALCTSPLTTQSASSALSLLPVSVVSRQTKSAQWLPHGDRREPVCAISARCDSMARSRLAQEWTPSRGSLGEQVAPYISHPPLCQPKSDNLTVYPGQRARCAMPLAPPRGIAQPRGVRYWLAAVRGRGDAPALGGWTLVRKPAQAVSGHCR